MRHMQVRGKGRRREGGGVRGYTREAERVGRVGEGGCSRQTCHLWLAGRQVG
jgi:hypothetical protein